jgi:GcrA cell cycle regulator
LPSLFPNLFAELQFRISEIRLDIVFGISEIKDVARQPVSGRSRQGKGHFMQSFSWTAEHSAALQEYVTRGMSYAEAADALNARFGTAYTRSAALGRGKRLGLVVPPRREVASKLAKRAVPSKAAFTAPQERDPARASMSVESIERAEPVKLRCVGIRPRLVPLIELEDGECRYPYGGDRDDEPIMFCGHPRFRSSPYCAPHFHLTRRPAVEADRPAGPVVLRLVRAA